MIRGSDSAMKSTKNPSIPQMLKDVPSEEAGTTDFLDVLYMT